MHRIAVALLGALLVACASAQPQEGASDLPQADDAPAAATAESAESAMQLSLLGQYGEEQVKTLSADVASLEEAKNHAFTPPPKAWIESRVAALTDLLEQRTGRSASAFRRLASPSR